MGRTPAAPNIIKKVAIPLRRQASVYTEPLARRRSCTNSLTALNMNGAYLLAEIVTKDQLRRFNVVRLP